MITGMLLGALGSVFNQGLGIYRDRQQAKIDKERRSDEYEMAKLGVTKDTQISSYIHDTSLGDNISQWVANVRALVRPVITAYGMILVTIFYFATDDAGKTVLIACTIELTTMAVAWWFADKFKK